MLLASDESDETWRKLDKRVCEARIRTFAVPVSGSTTQLPSWSANPEVNVSNTHMASLLTGVIAWCRLTSTRERAPSLA